MTEPKISTRQFINGVNETMAKLVKENPQQFTLTCTECEKEYVANDLADLFVCPHCGKTQHDEEDFEEE